MKISSSGYMSVSPALTQSLGMVATASPTADVKTASTPSPRPVLFSGGQFVGTAQLTSPATLAALFQLNDDGSLKLSELGAPVMKKGATIQTTQDDMAKFLAFGPSSTWTASDQAVTSNLSLITDDDKALFRKVTGYNLFINGPAALIVDDEGNMPSAADRAAAEELFYRLSYARETGTDINADWFSGVSDDISAAGGTFFPADWEAKADEWFDKHFEARREDGARRLAQDAYTTAATLGGESSGAPPQA